MALKTIPPNLNQQLNQKFRKEKKKRLKPIRNPKAPEVRYRKQLLALTRKLKEDINSLIVPLLKRLEPEYVNDAYALSLQESFERLRKAYENINVQAQSIAQSFVNNSDQVNKRRFYSAVEEAIGIDLKSVISEEGLDDILIGATRQNVSLIKSIPEEYFKKIETVVFTGTTQGRTVTSMLKQIQDIGGVTANRARLIARDQSSKLNSALNQQRQQNLGVEEYMWRTAEDDRVRETHKSKNGKVFRWDDPPSDTGHPGYDPACRCVAQALIKF